MKLPCPIRPPVRVPRESHSLVVVVVVVIVIMYVGPETTYTRTYEYVPKEPRGMDGW